MSGTSLDGLDMAYCIFQFKQGSWTFDIVLAKTVAYPPDLFKKLVKCTTLTGLDLSLLDVELGRWMGIETAAFIDDNHLKIDLISSHGHTVFHQPEHGLTLQVGSGLEIQRACGITVINDFRSKDVSLGGQGAPLVPIGDELLFGDNAACLNLGGIANVSFLHHGERIAYDIAPVNMVFNYLSLLKGEPFDDRGKIASAGKIDDSLLARFNELAYYKSPYPKSLGYEWVYSNIISVLEHSTISIEDQMATTVAHATTQIAEVLPQGKNLITGGGAFNNYFIDQLNSKLSAKHEIVIPDKTIIEYKEAMIFALLGVLRYRNEINCLSTVTGAQSDSSGGTIFTNIS